MTTPVSTLSPCGICLLGAFWRNNNDPSSKTSVTSATRPPGLGIGTVRVSSPAPSNTFRGSAGTW